MVAPRIVTSYDVRSGAVASRDHPDVVYIDPHIPEKFWPFLAEHEMVERHEMIDNGRSYLDAHTNYATLAEKAKVEAAGLNWKKYTHEIDGYLDEVEHEPAPNPPPDPHVDIDSAIGHHRHKWQASKAMDKQKFSASVSVRARSLDIPNGPHPNKMPFSGVLTKIGQPSDAAPEGSGGKRVMITAEAARTAVDSLLGMAVDYQADYAGHDPQAKIGVITGANVAGDEILVNGFIYAADFPQAAQEIKANKLLLGMSFEARDLMTYDTQADPIEIVDCVFTGAAILLKDKAAYKTTSIYAAKAQHKDFTMDAQVKEQFDAIAASLGKVTESLTKVSESVSAQATEIAELKKAPEKMQAANYLSKVEPHAVRLEAAADKMENDGVGGHAGRGHVAVLRGMASSMRAEAVKGKIPHVFDTGDWMYAAAETKVSVEDQVKSAVEKATAEFTKTLGEVKAAAEVESKKLKDEAASAATKLADMQAQAEKAATEKRPERKTLSPGHMTLLAKAGIELPADDTKIAPEKLNKALVDAGLNTDQRFQLKTALARVGAIA